MVMFISMGKVASVGGGLTYHQSLINNGDITALWPFEETAGSSPTTIDDVKGTNDLAVTVSGDIRPTADSIASGAAQSMQLANNSPDMTLTTQPNAATFSYGLVVKTGSVAPGATQFRIFGNATFANTRLRYTATALEVAIRIGSTTTVSAGYTMSWAANTTYKIDVTWDGSVLRLYLNGSQVDSVTPGTGGSANWASGPGRWFPSGVAVPSDWQRSNPAVDDATKPRFSEFYIANDDLTSAEIAADWAII